MKYCLEKILLGFCIAVSAFILIQKKGYSADVGVAAEKIVRQMTDEQLAGQLMIIGLDGEKFSNRIGYIIRTYSPGGVFLNGANLSGRNLVKNFTDELQQFSAENGIGLFIATDQEGGTVARVRDGVTLFPGNMAFGNINDPKLVYEAAVITGYELRLLGINMNFAPCLDLADSDPRSIVNIRSYGQNSSRVSELGIACIRGLQEESNCIAVAKHFPGHGAVFEDSHCLLPVTHATLNELKLSGMIPFVDAMGKGLEAVMSAHISFISIDPSGKPSSVSSVFNRRILRVESRYEGLIITDDLSMEGMKSVYREPRAAVEALSSGADMVLVATDRQVYPVYNAIRDGIRSGVLDRMSLRKSAERIVKAKIRFRIISAEQKQQEIFYGKISKDLLLRKNQINAEASAKSLFEYSGNPVSHPLPIDRKQSIVVTDNSFFAAGLLHEKIIVVSEKNAASKIVQLRKEGVIPRVYYLVDSFSPVILRQLRELWIEKEISLVLLFIQNPFPCLYMFPKENFPPFICTFSPTERSLVALIDSLCGRITPGNEIPGLFKPLLSDEKTFKLKAQ